MRCRDPLGPCLKLSACPLEAVIGMSEGPCGEGRKAHVVLGIWRGQHHRSWPGELEHYPLEGRQSRRVEVLDHLNHRRSIEAVQACVPIEQRALN
jgi:hypothetical protein